MELSPSLYHWLVRPKWSTNKYIHRHVKEHFELDNRVLLDFGAGIGSNCTLSKPSHYFGIDPDEKRVHYAKKVYPEYSFNVFTGDRIPLEDHSVDMILIIAVLHHIPCEQIKMYMKEFQRILTLNSGAIIVMEPCFTDQKSICNWYMATHDKGKYIRNEEGYLNLFNEYGFQSKVLKKYRKCYFYNEVFFYASYI
ncbi:class I SAM-dependent methyltransferase [Metabacillus herbersteinensis]|uniref:Class I SAM-dependent methyltransferase n=1 Tax=Metabacillus herbersteinensis TaxID=283816 RepID=A0ABV6GI81_9BACI